MATSLTIDGTALSSLGLYLKGISGHLGVGEPKPQGSGREEFTSVNYFLPKYVQQSPEITVRCFGKFESITAGETALYTLYGLLIGAGERTFIHTSGASSIQFKGFMHKGASVDYKLTTGGGIFFDITIKIIKTND